MDCRYWVACNAPFYMRSETTVPTTFNMLLGRRNPSGGEVGRQLRPLPSLHARLLVEFAVRMPVGCPSQRPQRDRGREARRVPASPDATMTSSRRKSTFQ
ncbi:hypothetical protein KC333_g92 [Hortaea werneckii]|nr:hypothetical protein KC333_g92 [Hortaea werneckii]